ncbi:LOW QUALITY PROTEIN: INO80 complex subunit D-like [Tachypleus tridentatus]|uniref:LOW QUALITY PROTEIN: INO80 complex subunit D-like n=1 Tax=Tachypleus tridentatus TaxID=6853 RepID=UPI003FD316F5
MFEGKHIHFSPADNKPLCSYSAKLCKQRRLNGYAFCIRHILEDKTAPFKQCAHVAKYNNQKCTNPIPSNEYREFCNSHMQVAGMLPKKERKTKKEKESITSDGKVKFADRLRALLKKENSELLAEDTFNADDPYAFPEPFQEKESVNTGSKTFNPKLLSETINIDVSMKGEQLQNRGSISDNRSKFNTPKLSKTMNRLQAKIAQNKFLDKLKKAQDSSQQILCSNSIKVHETKLNSQPVLPVSTCKLSTCIQMANHKTNFIRSKVKSNGKSLVRKTLCDTKINGRRIRSMYVHSLKDSVNSLSSLKESGNVSHKFQTVQKVVIEKDDKKPKLFKDVSKTATKYIFLKLNLTSSQKFEKPKDDLAATGKLHELLQGKKRQLEDYYVRTFEDSESEESEGEEAWKCQLHWFCSWNRNKHRHNMGNTFSRLIQQSQLKSEVRRHCVYIHQVHSLQEEQRVQKIRLGQCLLEAARHCPNRAANMLLKDLKLLPKPRKIMKSVGLDKRICCYQNEGTPCLLPALPYTRHCVSHIMYNVDQLLFEHCTGKFADNTQCCTPVFDVLHELPLCPEHAKKKDNYNKVAFEPKPKKPRKKPKPSALTRPTKRNKKKKKHQNIRPLSPTLSSHLNENESNSSTVIKSEPVSMEVESQGDVGEVKDLGGQLNSELGSDLEEQFSPGTIEKTLEFPLDAAELAHQASKLLEEHDFTEVLNKIPDEAFTELFAESKNGEYVPTREETEELERALAAVSKDVRMAKESLAKLSVTGRELNVLATSDDLRSGLLETDNLVGQVNENSFHHLTHAGLHNLSVITSSLSSDLTSLSEDLSSMAQGRLSHSSPVSEGHILQNNLLNVPILPSDISHSTAVNGYYLGQSHVQADGFGLLSSVLDSGPVSYSGVDPEIASSVDCSFPHGASLFSTTAVGIGNSHTSTPNTGFSSVNTFLTTGVGSISSTGEENVPSVDHTLPDWFLPGSESVSAFSHPANQNGFFISSTANGQVLPSVQQLLSTLGKYPLQTLNTELSVVSSPSNLSTPMLLSEKVTDSDHIQTVCVAGTSNVLPGNTGTVIAQGGAS